MENTTKVLFDDPTPQWYIALSDRWVGPLSAGDVYEKIQSGELSWAHYAWKKGQSEWKRLCDIKAFEVAVPSAPKKSIQAEIKEASSPSIRAAGGKRGAAATPPPMKRVEEKIWFLHYNDSQFGPFTADDVERFLKAGKIHAQVHAWKGGMGDWKRLGEIDEFAVVASSGKKPAPPASKKQPGDQRGSPRRPMVAQVLMANKDVVISGVCRDISVGGMQVLTAQIPGGAGTRLRLNVSPTGDQPAADKQKIQPFVAEGVVVRVLEDGCGFSFRFEKLEEGAKRAIESYISTSV